MPGPSEDILDIAELDQFAGVHNAYAIAHFRHHAHVVSYEQNRHVPAVLLAFEQGQDLRLDGHVERSRRFIGHQQARPIDQGGGYNYPLAHAAAEPVRRVLVPDRRVDDPGTGQCLGGDAPRFRPADPLVSLDRLRHLVTD